MIRSADWSTGTLVQKKPPQACVDGAGMKVMTRPSTISRSDVLRMGFLQGVFEMRRKHRIGMKKRPTDLLYTHFGVFSLVDLKAQALTAVGGGIPRTTPKPPQSPGLASRSGRPWGFGSYDHTAPVARPRAR